MRFLFALILAAAVAGCGFQLRGAASAQLPYKTMFIALPETADVNVWLQRHIKATGSTEIVDELKAAEAVFQQLGDQRQKSILSINSLGRVREYRLTLTYTFRVITPEGKVLVPPNEITLVRDVTHDDSKVLAKDIEENLLWRDMHTDLVGQIMRRLSVVKPLDPNREDAD